ncbi:hypothetical protein EIP86_006941 [Pleurotus ostreatoroseus]|nr:hypothetical protein EIP86_006941 [Pleurotus ostreatoroseus]
MEEGTSPAQTGQSRGRGRGKSRGGLGKYLRARGRGRGRGRPAEFGRRLVLEGEQEVELTEEEAKDLEKKYARRQLGSNADRYVEPEPELDSDGEPIVEPEVDLTAFLEKQRQDPEPSAVAAPLTHDEDEIDASLAHMVIGGAEDVHTKKGKVQQMQWDASLEEMSREKAAADAARDLKARFREKTERERTRLNSGSSSSRRRGAYTALNWLTPINVAKPFFLVEKSEKPVIEAPALPTDGPQPVKTDKEQMEDFLDDLIG